MVEAFHAPEKILELKGYISTFHELFIVSSRSCQTMVLNAFYILPYVPSPLVAFIIHHNRIAKARSKAYLRLGLEIDQQRADNVNDVVILPSTLR